MIATINVVCRACNAAVGARCTEPKLDGNRFIETFHRERVLDAIDKQSKEDLEKSLKEQSEKK